MEREDQRETHLVNGHDAKDSLDGACSAQEMAHCAFRTADVHLGRALLPAGAEQEGLDGGVLGGVSHDC